MCVFWPDSFFQPIYRLHSSVHWLTDGATSTCGSLDALARDSCIRSAPNVKCIYYGNMVDRPRAVQRCFNLSHATCPRSTRIYIYICICIKCTCTRVRIKKLYRKTRMLQHTFLIHPSLFRNNLLRIASIYIIITEKITDSKYWVLDPLVAKEYRSLTNTPL